MDRRTKDLVLRTGPAIVIIFAIAGLKIAGLDLPALILAGCGAGALIGLAIRSRLRGTGAGGRHG